MRQPLAPDLEAAGIRLAISGCVLGALGLGIRLARPGDIGWGGVLVALVWGAAAFAAGVAAVRGARWGAPLGVSLLGLALAGLAALAFKVAALPDRWSGLAGIAVVAGVLATALWGLARHAARPAASRARARPVPR